MQGKTKMPNQGSSEGTDVDFSGQIFATLCFVWHNDFLSVSESKRLNGAKREKEILFGGKAPPMAGAILMFLRLAFGKPLQQLPSCC